MEYSLAPGTVLTLDLTRTRTQITVLEDGKALNSTLKKGPWGGPIEMECDIRMVKELNGVRADFIVPIQGTTTICPTSIQFDFDGTPKLTNGGFSWDMQPPREN